jgi:hypothetical protein
MRYNRSGTNHRALADFNAGQYHRACSDPGAVMDADRRGSIVKI